MRSYLSLAWLGLAASMARAATPNDWRGRIIYQVMTDRFVDHCLSTVTLQTSERSCRFARTDGSTTASCITDEQTYCGGTYRGIINHLDYIQDMGFTAVSDFDSDLNCLAMLHRIRSRHLGAQIWISPIVKQIQDVSNGAPYHGYWAQDIYSLNDHFGTAQDLKDLSSALHSRGMVC